jgi:hypothetical protein
MSVYPSVDDADFFKDYKTKKTLTVSDLPKSIRQAYETLDYLEDLLHHPELRSPTNAHITGSMMGKVIILRINLDVFFNVKTPHYSERQTSTDVADSVHAGGTGM